MQTGFSAPATPKQIRGTLVQTGFSAPATPKHVFLFINISGACGALGSSHGIYNNIDPYLSASPWYRPRPLRIPGVRVTHRLTVRLLVRTLHSGHRSGGMKYAGPLRGTPRPLGASAERSESAPRPAYIWGFIWDYRPVRTNPHGGSMPGAAVPRLELKLTKMWAPPAPEMNTPSRRSLIDGACAGLRPRYRRAGGSELAPPARGRGSR